MDALRETIFEKPFWIYIALVWVEMAVIVFWHFQRTRRSARMMIIPILLAGVVYLTETLVVTDREAVTKAVRKIAHDAEHGRIDAAKFYVDEQYRGYFGKGKKVCLQAYKAALMRFGVKSVRFLQIDVVVFGDEAILRCVTMVEFAGTNPDIGKAVLSWRIHWTRHPEGWRIIHVDQPRQSFDLL